MFHLNGPTFFEIAQQALSSTERGYGLLAPKFDLTPFRMPAPLLAAVAPYVGAPGSLASALDLCCGTGAALEMLRPLLCRERLVGVGFSQGMLDEARRRLAAGTGTATVELVRPNVLELDAGVGRHLVETRSLGLSNRARGMARPPSSGSPGLRRITGLRWTW